MSCFSGNNLTQYNLEVINCTSLWTDYHLNKEIKSVTIFRYIQGLFHHRAILLLCILGGTLHFKTLLSTIGLRRWRRSRLRAFITELLSCGNAISQQRKLPSLSEISIFLLPNRTGISLDTWNMKDCLHETSKLSLPAGTTAHFARRNNDGDKCCDTENFMSGKKKIIDRNIQ